jgi:hypothetical protein
MLQRLLAKTRRVTVEASLIRKVMLRNGYKWLPRSKKPKFSTEVKAARKAWAEEVVAMSDAALRERFSFAMDGVVLTLPPKGLMPRENFCRATETHCWRKPSEALSEDIAGGNKYNRQVPLSRALPLWGGCSPGGFAAVLWHENKKITAEEWAEAVEAGKLKQAILSLNPSRRRGPWYIIADNEGFLRAPAAQAAHEKLPVRLWRIPAGSPDLNPVEKFWAWLRRHLVAMDLKDLREGRAAASKPAFKARVQRLLKTQSAQRVAASCSAGLRKVCRKVILKDGSASGT